MKVAQRLLVLLSLVALGYLAVVAVGRWRRGIEAPVIPAIEALPAPRGPGSRIQARGLGKVEAVSEEIPVSSDVTGRIAEILVDEGSTVEKGAILARLEPFVYQSRVEAARAALAKSEAHRKLLEAGARSEEIDVARAALNEARASHRLAMLAWERTRQLLAAGDIPQHQGDSVREEAEGAGERVRAAEERLRMALNLTRREELEAAVAEVDERRHELAVATAELDKTILRAPIKGTIIRKNLRIGEAVSPFQITPIVTIADLDHLRVRAEVDEIDLGRVQLGQKVEVEVLATPGQPIPGKVERIAHSMGRRKLESNDPNAKVDVRVIEVLIALEGRHELPLGLRVNAAFLAAQ